MIKNGLAIGLILLLAFISGCATGAGAGEDNIASSANAPNIINTAEQLYIAEDIPIPPDFTPYSARFLAREIFLFDGQGVLVMDQEGHELRRAIFSKDEFFSAVDLQADRSFWAASLDYGDGEAGMPGVKPDKLSFVLFERDGSELERVATDGSLFMENEEVMHPQRLIFANDHFYLMSYHAVYVISKSGELVMEMKAEGENSRGGEGLFLSLFKLKDGKLAAASYSFSSRSSEQVYLIQIPNLENNEIEEITIPLMGADSGGIFLTGAQADLLLCANAGFYDYDLESGDMSLIFNPLRHGLDVNSLAEVAIFDDGSIALAERAQAGAQAGSINRLAMFTRFDPSLGSETQSEEPYEEIAKQTVTLSAVFVDVALSTLVAEFNRNNRYFYVDIRDYSDNGRVDGDEAIMRLNIDFTTGNAPDINVLPFWWPSDIYTSKGIYADLNSFMENDDNFNKSDYLPGIFEAMDLDSKLYELFPLFTLDAIFAKTADVGTGIGWNLDEFAAFIDTKNNAQHIIGTWTKKSFITQMISQHFVNPNSGVTQFDRDDFLKILAIADRFPASIQDQGMELMESLKDGDPLMWGFSIGSLADLSISEYLYFGEDITLKGYPSPKGNGLSFSSFHNFGIMDQAENPDGAWEFLKFALDYEKEGSAFIGFLPVKISLLEKMADDEKKNFESGNTSFPGGRSASDIGERFSVGINQTIEAAKATRNVSRINLSISNIISEEVDSYLGGQKSADSVADIIENRIGIYLAEQE